MKKFTKVCLIICLALVCVSIICIGAGAAMGSSLKEVQMLADDGYLNFPGFVYGWDLFDWFVDDGDSGDLQEKVRESFPAADVRELDIDLKYGSISIEDSDSEDITISIDAPKRHKYVCKMDGDTMVLEETTKYRVKTRYSLRLNVVIGIPAGTQFDEVKFKTSAGEVMISHSLYAGEASLEVDAGQITAEKITAEKELDLETGAGQLILENFTADVLTMDCGVGEMIVSGKAQHEVDATCGVGSIMLSLEGKEEDYDYDLSCGVGSITINNQTFGGLGSHKSVNNHATGEITLDCGVGSIEVEIKE